MEYRPFGPTGADVSVIGQGTWQLRDVEDAREALAVGLDLGMTHIDTAELYTGSEEAIAPVIAGRREDVFLVSKVLPRNASRDGVIRACRRSLDRLDTDHLDVYLLHWPSRDHPLEETMGALAELVDRGWTRHVGVSNFDVDGLEAVREALGGVPLACNQVLYHLGDRGIENHVIPYCGEEGIAVVAYSPFGSGRFPAPGSPGRAALEGVAARHGKTARQVALNFLTRHDHVFAIPKAEDPAHVRDNAGGAGWALAAEDVAAIEEAFPRPPPGPLGFL